MVAILKLKQACYSKGSSYILIRALFLNSVLKSNFVPRIGDNTVAVGCLFGRVCRFTSETAELIELKYVGSFLLVWGCFLGYKFSRSIHQFTGNKKSQGNKMSICQTAKPIELKFCGKLPVGPGRLT